MIEALERYLVHAARTEDHLGSVVTALESVADTPWDVIRLGSLLARSVLAHAEEDLGITRQLTRTSPGGKNAVLTVAQGQPFPLPIQGKRRSRVAVDPPLHMARRVVASALEAVEGPVFTALDPACGCGAFLLALAEAGVPEIYGTDLDEVALAVAQIAVPQARVLRESPLIHGPPVDLLVGAPPYLPPERQDPALRRQLLRRFPWLGARMDLTLPFAASGVERVRPGGAAGLVLPSSALLAPYAAVTRRRWLQRHRVAEISGPHDLHQTQVSFVVLGVKQKPTSLPVYGTPPEEVLRLDNAPLNADLMPGDVQIFEKIWRNSMALERVASIETGLIVHGPQGSQDRMIHEEPGDDRVLFADADDFFSGRFSHLDYSPNKLHRAKSRALFTQSKIVVKVARGKGPIKAAVDWDGVFLDHSCALVCPHPGAPPLERLLELFRSPLVDAVARIERGVRVDLHPIVLRGFPVPRAWIDDPKLPLEAAWGLDRDEVDRLERIAR